MTNYFTEQATWPDDDDEYDYWSDSDGDWSDDPWPKEAWPDPILERHPRFIVVRDDDEDELTGFSVRGRGQDRTYDDGEYPIYNEPLLRGDALWCELAATALNERG